MVFARGMQAVADRGEMPHEGGCEWMTLLGF